MTTSKELLAQLGLAVKVQPDLFGCSAFLQLRLEKYLRLKDDFKVREWLIMSKCLCPKGTLIDEDILREACCFLGSKGWELHFDENHNDDVDKYAVQKKRGRTARELLAENGFDKNISGADEAKRGFAMQIKLIKHLEAKNVQKVKDYLITIRCLWPDIERCPVDQSLIKKAAGFLKSQGWEFHLGENHDDDISRYIRRA
ncbi:MAG TPA: hypothetical protein DDZ91_12020 [Firmicutes bacterium]|nr:hypothetical protein [Bacillota bacterium]